MQLECLACCLPSSDSNAIKWDATPELYVLPPNRRFVAVALSLRTVGTYTTFPSSFTEESAKELRKVGTQLNAVHQEVKTSSKKEQRELK